MVRSAQASAGPLTWLGELESRYLRKRLDSIPLSRPLYIAGLARSGTTILLEQLVRTGHFATHRYRDFPFLATPFLWNRYVDLATRPRPAVPRPHGDRISITAESPDAFEEPLWQQFFPWLHAQNKSHLLTDETHHIGFEQFYRDHLRKLLLIRSKRRYLSKGNYNVTRIEYLGRLFPDAHFIVPIRHPADHVRSLVQQHVRFSDYAAADSRIPHYLECAGHYEFGPQRRAIRLEGNDGDRTDQAWRDGHDALGYAIQWSQIYRYIDEVRHRGDDLSTRVHIVRFEDFCDAPHETLASILHHGQLSATPLEELSFESISKPSTRSMPSAEIDDVVWREAGLVAQAYGYDERSSKPSSDFHSHSARAKL